MEQQLIEAIARMSEIMEKFSGIDQRLERVENQVYGISPPDDIDKYAAAKLLSIDVTTLARWRKRTEWSDGSYAWIEGVHYIRLPGEVRYSRAALEHWKVHRRDFNHHHRFVEAFTESKAKDSDIPRKRGTSKKVRS